MVISKPIWSAYLITLYTEKVSGGTQREIRLSSMTEMVPFIVFIESNFDGTFCTDLNNYITTIKNFYVVVNRYLYYLEGIYFWWEFCYRFVIFNRSAIITNCYFEILRKQIFANLS